MKDKYTLFVCIFLMISGIIYASPPNWQPIQGNLYSMVVIAEIYLYDDLFTGLGSNMAGAFGPGGITDCRSIGAWQSSKTCYWDGYWYFTVVGNVNGEQISFKIYNEVTDSIYNCHETIIFQNNQTIGSPQDPFILLTDLCPPHSVVITVNNITGIPTISWTPVNGASSYYIYTGNSPDIETTPGTYIAHVDTNSWSDLSKSIKRRFYIITSSNDTLQRE